ncbi:MAG: hypothetical protein H6620_06320 [Halobacteriovoraceae bacterium]|nr:hypothetical protein [Halobacteriovoraceae bacterium]
MGHIIILDNRDSEAKSLKLKLLTNLKMSAVIKSTIKEATEIVELIPNIKIIIGLDEIAGENLVEMLSLYAESVGKRVEHFTYAVDQDENDIVRSVAEKINVSLDEDQLKNTTISTRIFYAVNLKYVKEVEPPCDLYIRIGQSQNEIQYIKRVHAFEFIDEEIFAKLLSYGSDEVFIHRNDYDIFFTFLTNKFIKNLSENNNLNKMLEHQYEAYQYIIDHIQTLEFDEHMVDLVDNFILSIKESIINQKQLSNLINAVVTNKDSLFFQTFYLTNLMSFFLLRKENLHNEKTLEHYTYTSLFCDLNLEERNTFFINSESELEESLQKSKLTPDEYARVKSHAQKNAEFLSSYPDLDREILQYIREHHGNNTGTSFSDNPGKSIGIQSKIFMIGNTFIKYFLNPVYKFNKKTIIEKMILRFSGDDELRRLSSLLTQKVE